MEQTQATQWLARAWVEKEVSNETQSILVGMQVTVTPWKQPSKNLKKIRSQDFLAWAHRLRIARLGYLIPSWHLPRCLASRVYQRCWTSSFGCRYLNPYMKLKLIELAINSVRTLFQKKIPELSFQDFSRPQINFFRTSKLTSTLSLPRSQR